MPFKHNAFRRQRVPKARYRVANWPAYEAGLRRRGDLMFWLDEEALTGGQAPPRTTPGGQPRYSDLAIELVLTLRLVFHLALRQAEAFTRSVLRLLRLVTGRARSHHPVPPWSRLRLSAAPHGRKRRQWRKLHLAVGAGGGEIAAHVLTEGTTDDAAQAPALLDQVKGRISSVTADGAYDSEPV